MLELSAETERVGKARIDGNTEIMVGHRRFRVHLIESPSRMSIKLLERGNGTLEMGNNHHMQGLLRALAFSYDPCDCLVSPAFLCESVSGFFVKSSFPVSPPFYLR